jgi:hypothetical protein
LAIRGRDFVAAANISAAGKTGGQLRKLFKRKMRPLIQEMDYNTAREVRKAIIGRSEPKNRQPIHSSLMIRMAHTATTQKEFAEIAEIAINEGDKYAIEAITKRLFKLHQIDLDELHMKP